MVKFDLNDPQRRIFTMEATFQMEALLNTLLDAAKSKDRLDQLEFLTKAAVPRLVQLNAMVLAGASDDEESSQSIFKGLEF